MPWCPRCDEVFPDGAACPRCRARMVERDDALLEAPDPLAAVPGLRQIKLSRRYRRALERLSAGPHPPRTIALSIVALVFVAGFLLGRFVGFGPSVPTVGVLPPASPLSRGYVSGSVAYAVWSDQGLATIAVHDLYSGQVAPVVRFSTPVQSAALETQVVAFGRSVALVARDGTRSCVAFAAYGAAPVSCVAGVEAAWGSEHELFVRRADGAVVRWLVSGDDTHSEPSLRARRLFQTPGGAVADQGGALVQLGTPARMRLPLPPHGRVLAVSPDARRAVVDDRGPALWDGRALERLRVDGYGVAGASFERSGQRVALTLRRDGRLTLAVVDGSGQVALQPLGAPDRDCVPVPAWDDAGRWIYVTGGDGVLYAAQAAATRVVSVRTAAAGCGLAWLDV